MVVRKIYRDRVFAHSMFWRAADKVTAVDWPGGTLLSEVRDCDGVVVATFTVDETNRAAADGGEIVLRLSLAEARAITAPDGTYEFDITDESGTVILPKDWIVLQGVVTEVP